MDRFFPLEFFVNGTPLSLGASASSKGRWRETLAEAARNAIEKLTEQSWLDQRPVALTIFYFPDAAMEGDIDNIVKPIADAMVGVVYIDDREVERVVVQKFEPETDWVIAVPSERLAEALDNEPPIVYVRIDDSLDWRHL